MLFSTMLNNVGQTFEQALKEQYRLNKYVLIKCLNLIYDFIQKS